MIVPIIMAAAALASAYASAQAQKQQGAIAANQAAQAQRGLGIQQAMADQQLEMSRAGTRNARGDTTQYVPGVGWVETLSPQSARMQGASDAETEQRYGDLARSREGRKMNFDTRLQERGVADKLLRDFQGQQGRSPAAIEAAMIERNVAAAQDPIDAERRSVQLNALRGNSGAADTIAALSREGARGTRSAIAEARLQAPGAAQEESAAAHGNTLNQYNVVGTRAANIDDVPFDPQNIPSTLAARGQAQANLAPNLLSGASTSSARGFTLGTQYPGQAQDWGAAVGSAGMGANSLYEAFADRQTGKKKSDWQQIGNLASSGGGGGYSGGQATGW